MMYVNPHSRMVTIYFIQAGDGGPIKIGWAVDPLLRLREIQKHNHCQLHLRATRDAARSDETEYHHLFKAHRMHGEWFRPAPEILAEIAEINAEAEIEVRCTEIMRAALKNACAEIDAKQRMDRESNSKPREELARAIETEREKGRQQNPRPAP